MVCFCCDALYLAIHFTGSQVTIAASCKCFAPTIRVEHRALFLQVRAIRRGWIKPSEERNKEKEPAPPYLLWDDDGIADYTRTGAGLAYIPAPKPELPGHEESYNPPAEYLPTEQERQAIIEAAEYEDRHPWLPQSFDSVRQVPQYARIVQERFERCLDLYLCPRVRNKRMQYKAEDLVPKALPQPRDLKPFPNRLCVTFSGHRSKVRSASGYKHPADACAGNESALLSTAQCRM